MVDVINIRVCDDHFVHCSTETIARDGEGQVAQLVVVIPESLSQYWAYFDFKQPNGERFKTPRLDLDDNKIVYNIPSAVLTGNGELEWQYVAQDADGFNWKSNTKTFNVRYSVNAVDDIPDKKDFIAEAQQLLDDIREGAGGGGGYVIVDDHLSATSKNPVQNRVVTEKFAEVDTTIGNIDALLYTI